MKFPNDADGNALRTIATRSDVSKPMNIDFMVAVPDQAAGETVASRVLGRGYVPSLALDEESGQWTCYCTKQMIPEYDAIVSAQRELDALSADVRGYSDGWGTFGNTSP